MTELYNEGGYTIALSERNRFRLKGPEMRDDDGQEFETYAAALDKVNKLTSARAKRKSRNLALPVLVLHGGRYDRQKLDEAVLTGAHATNGNLLFKPKIEISRYDNSGVYVDAPVVRALVSEQLRIKAELDAVAKKLAKVEIGEPGYHIRDKDYEKAMDALEAEYAAAKAEAEAMTAEEQAA